MLSRLLTTLSLRAQRGNREPLHSYQTLPLTQFAIASLVPRSQWQWGAYHKFGPLKPKFFMPVFTSGQLINKFQSKPLR